MAATKDGMNILCSKDLANALPNFILRPSSTNSASRVLPLAVFHDRVNLAFIINKSKRALCSQLANVASAYAYSVINAEIKERYPLIDNVTGKRGKRRSLNSLSPEEAEKEKFNRKMREALRYNDATRVYRQGLRVSIMRNPDFTLKLVLGGVDAAPVAEIKEKSEILSMAFAPLVFDCEDEDDPHDNIESLADPTTIAKHKEQVYRTIIKPLEEQLLMLNIEETAIKLITAIMPEVEDKVKKDTGGMIDEQSLEILRRSFKRRLTPAEAALLTELTRAGIILKEKDAGDSKDVQGDDGDDGDVDETFGPLP